MTTPSLDPTPTAPPKPASRWEDFIDIFYTPSTVYERRQNQNPWPTILIITALFAIITILTFNSLEPLIESELRADAAKAMAKNPQMTQDMADMGIRMQLGGRKWGTILMPIGFLFGALVLWLVSKIVGAKENYVGALSIITYASIIAVVQLLAVGAQALVLDVSTMTTPDQLSLGAARFVDKASTAPALYGFLKSLDVFTIWSLIVTCIGVRVIGKVDKNRAILFGVIWFIGSASIMALAAWWPTRG